MNIDQSHSNSPDDSRAPASASELEASALLPQPELNTSSPIGHPEIRVEYVRPVEFTAQLANGNIPESPEFQALQTKLAALPGFLRVSGDHLLTYSQGFEHVVNCTGYSGQGIHPGQKELLREAFAAILKDQGWDADSTLLISGGTAVGVPDEFISTLTERERYQAAAVMALPGVEYPITPGYSFVCTDEKWKNWGDEIQTMSAIATETIVAGGGVQAFTDALHAARDNEPIAVIVNTFNAMGRVEYEIDGKPADLILRSSASAIERGSLTPLHSIQEQLRASLIAEGMPSEDASRARITSLPVSGLVTEVRKGERRACSQDLLYFAITGNAELLPQEFRAANPQEVETLRMQLVEHLDLYYLLDDPYEGMQNSAVIKLDDAIQFGNTAILDKIIDHAVLHDVHSPNSGMFGPSALGAKSPEALASLLKSALHDTISHRAA